LLRDLPPRARGYIVTVIAVGGLAFALLLSRATLSPVLPLVVFVLLSSLFAAFKVQFPIASGSNMSLSYVVDIACLILRGPHTAMIVGAAAGWSQSTFNTRDRNPGYRTLFNMACLVLTTQAAGQVYVRLGGTSDPDPSTVLVPLAGMALTYFVANTLPIAIAIALTTRQDPWRVWRTEFVPNAPSYVLGAGAAAVVIEVTNRSGYWLTLLLILVPLYLTFKVYRAGIESEARQGAILEAAHDAIITMDQGLNIREFNPAAEQMFGYSRSHVLGRRVDLLVPPEDRQAQFTALLRYKATGEGPLAGRQQIELTGLRADGTPFPIELTVARLGSDQRAVVTGFVRDITGRRALEEQLRQSQKLEAIGRLAAGVAHDFNNILASIMGSADLMLMQMDPADQARGEANEIKLSVQRGAGLTRQLLAFSRRQASSPRRIALDETVCGMETLLRRLIGPEIEFDVRRPPDPVSVIADPGQIEQVVLNLVVNARDAMEGGGRLTVRVDAVDLDEAAAVGHVEGRAGRYARLIVSDTGTGIDEATRARLFEPFFTTKEQGKGSGLGLPIVYGIARQSGGYVHVASEPGHGATFTIYLPLATS
jgi:PAS domain S-box-containing protein